MGRMCAAMAVAVVSCAGSVVLAEGAGVGPVDIEAAMGAARFVGMGDQIELVVPLPLDEGGRLAGAVGRQMVIKGVCGPDGAVATPEVLLAHARRDLERMNSGPARGSATAIYGESPKFVVSYDPADIPLVTLFLPNFGEAAEYIDSQLDDRVEIRIDLRTEDIPGSVIGSAGSVQYLYNYETYRQGLLAADNREPEDPFFANALPSGSFPVRYDGSTSSTAESSVVVYMSQLRAIFGDTSIDQATSTTITLDNTADWDYFVFLDNQVGSGLLSLVDVAAHEITHGLGFSSRMNPAGINPDNQMGGLDLARFRFSVATPFGVVGGPPLTLGQFASFPRIGDNIPFTDVNFYARPFVTTISHIELEGGDFSASGNLLQPSHLAYKQAFADKIGLMDPVISDGTTYGPGYWGTGEIGPLNDMGWKLIRAGDVVGDCNLNGLPDFIDIINGARDADNDFRLDSCELFYNPVSNAGSYANAITQEVYDAQGAQTLGQFNPAVNPLLTRFLVSGVDQSFGSGSVDTVRVYSGFIFAPAPDEYAFRVARMDDARLEIAAQTFNFTGPGSLNGFSSNAAPPVYIQLEQGWHAFKLTVLVSGTGTVSLRRESRSLGGWGPVPSGDFSGTFFDDCNANGLDDMFDQDSDGDGTPDDCEINDCDNDGIPDEQEFDCDNNGVPDDCEPRGDINLAFDVGQVGTASQVLEYGTCNSPAGFQFDTEIAIWDENGVFITNNDDGEGCNTFLLSRLDLQLPEGVYYIGTTGFNAFFSDDFGVDFATNACSAGGSYVLRVGSETVISEVDPGKVTFVRFSIGADSCPADLAAPFGVLNIFDIQAFIGLYNAQDPAADLAAPFGTLNIFDLQAYIALYNQGCP